MNLEPQNYLALLTSIIRTDPSLVGRIKDILQSYLQLEPYEDLLKDIDTHLQSSLRYVLNDINEIDSPSELEKEVQVLVNHLNSLEDDLSGDGIAAASIRETADAASESESEVPAKAKKAKAKAAAGDKKTKAKGRKKPAAKKAPARKKAKPAKKKVPAKKKKAARRPAKKKLRPAKRLKPKKRVPVKKKKAKAKSAKKKTAKKK